MSDQDKERPPEILGITDVDFVQWKHHPATKAFRRYIADYAAVLERDHKERWKQGPPDIDLEAEARGRVMTLDEIKELEFAHMLSFYAEPEEQKEEDEDARSTE